MKTYEPTAVAVLVDGEPHAIDHLVLEMTPREFAQDALHQFVGIAPGEIITVVAPDKPYRFRAVHADVHGKPCGLFRIEP